MRSSSKVALHDFMTMTPPLIVSSPTRGHPEDRLERLGHGRRVQATAAEMETDVQRGRQDGPRSDERAGLYDVHADQGVGRVAPGR